jgi:hypothetical protein
MCCDWLCDLRAAEDKKMLPALAGHITEASAQLTMPLVCCVLLWCVAAQTQSATSGIRAFYERRNLLAVVNSTLRPT